GVTYAQARIRDLLGVVRTVSGRRGSLFSGFACTRPIVLRRPLPTMQPRRARPTEYLPHFRGPPEHAIDAEFSEPPNRGKVLRRRDTDDLARAGLCPSSLEKAAPLDMRHGGAQ